MELSDIMRLISRVPDHAQNPRNNGPLENYNGHARITGTCGDTMEFWLLGFNDKLAQVSFVTDGCGSSIACGSMATCLAKGKRVKEVLNLRQKDILDALGGLPKETEHCALLAADTLKAACEDYLGYKKEEICEDAIKTRKATGQ
jgi:nitrogen fixation NifU-like protein